MTAWHSQSTTVVSLKAKTVATRPSGTYQQSNVVAMGVKTPWAKRFVWKIILWPPSWMVTVDDQSSWWKQANQGSVSCNFHDLWWPTTLQQHCCQASWKYVSVHFKECSFWWQHQFLHHQQWNKDNWCQKGAGIIDQNYYFLPNPL